MILQKIWSYITFKKQPEFRNNENEPLNTEEGPLDEYGKPRDNGASYLKMMHGINRISLLMFIIGMIIVIIKILK